MRDTRTRKKDAMVSLGCAGTMIAYEVQIFCDKVVKSTPSAQKVVLSFIFFCRLRKLIDHLPLITIPLPIHKGR